MTDHVLSFLSAYQGALSQAFSLPNELATDYELYDRLGESPEKSTYLLRRKDDTAFAVLKVATGGHREHLQMEYDVLNRVHAAYLPKAISCFSDQTSTYLLREYIAGVPVSDTIERRGPFSEAEAVRLCIGLCDALQELHAQTPPIIHRDIKPQNVIFTQQRTLALIDFDAARNYQSAQKKDTVYLGTQATAAPEQFGYQQTDQRSDLYSTGVLLLYLCTGSYELEALEKVSSRVLRHIIETCTQFDPNRRFASARHLRAQLMRQSRAMTRSSASFFGGVALGLGCGVVLCTAVYLLGVVPALQDGKAAKIASAEVTAIVPAADTAITFDTPEIEQAVREQLGVDTATPLYQSDLDRITTLYLFGDVSLTDWNTVVNDSLYHASTLAGGITSLADIPKLRNLTELSICCQQIADLSPLKGMRLVRLALSGNQISDLSPLKELPFLRELLIANNPIREIGVVGNLPLLQIIDLGSTSVSDITALGENMTAVYLADAPVFDYQPLLRMHSLRSLFITRPDQDDIAVLSQLTSLTELVLSYNLTSIEPLLSLTNLQSLALFEPQLTSIEGLETLEHLKYFRIGAYQNLDLTPLTKLPNLTALDIASQKISDYSTTLSLPYLGALYCTATQKSEIEALDVPISFQLNVV